MKSGIVCLLVLAFTLGGPALAEKLATTEDYREVIRHAWGPEQPETLEKFLEIREGLLTTYEKYENPIQQWALREAGTAPTFGPSLFAIMSLAKKVRVLSAERDMSYRDYVRLTYLVYGRWLHAVHDGVPKERRVVKALQELEIGLDRHLRNNPPEDPDELDKLEIRLASVRHQVEFLRPFAFEDKQAVLARIDPATREWMVENRERIERLDFHFLDTVPPPRPKETRSP